MKTTRKIIEIDEEKCTGCGQCILACAEGALELVDGKAKLVGDVYCDGLGACIGDCPEGALTVIEREADEFDEEKVEELLESKKHGESKEPLACGCPGSSAMKLDPGAACGCEETAGEIASQLGHWPVKLQLLSPQAPFLKGSDMLLLADCAATAFPDLHRKLLKDRAVAMGCPKLDDLDAHIAKLAEVLKGAMPKSLTVVHMEVPCCRGFVYAAEQAIERSGVELPLYRIKIGRTGEILEKETMSEKAVC